MIQLVYTSSAPKNLGTVDVFQIIEQSAKSNAASGLTGFLIYANNRFFQVIEGPFSAIDDLMERLQRDPRHHSIEIIYRSHITSPSFPKWRMKRIAVPDRAVRLEQLAPELADAPPAVKRAAQDFLALADA